MERILGVKEQWVLLYSAKQNAWHIETKAEYTHKPANGYRVIAESNSREEILAKAQEIRYGKR